MVAPAPTPAYPSQDDLASASDVLVWIDEEFLRPDPAAFATAREPFTSIATDISRQLDVDRNGIYCIGSGAVGLSTNPSKIEGGNLKLFDESSDIDIAVISWFHFEQAWRDIARSVQPHLEEWPELLSEHLAWQRRRLFDGAILAHKLLPVLSFGRDWAGAVERVAERIVKAVDRNVDVHIWIYRDYWSLRNYISLGVNKCRQKITINQGVPDDDA